MHHPLPIHLGYVYLADLVPKTSRIFKKTINASTSTAALIQINRVSIEVNSSPAWLSVSPSLSFWRCPRDPAAQNCSLRKINSLAKSLYAATLGRTTISTASPRCTLIKSTMDEFSELAFRAQYNALGKRNLAAIERIVAFKYQRGAAFNRRHPSWMCCSRISRKVARCSM
jgi:hypothetical protein